MSKIVALFACLAAALGLASAGFGAPLGASFDGLAYPFYTANGAANLYTVYPNGTSTVQSTTVIYGNDPANSRYAIDLGYNPETGVRAKQIVLRNITYETITFLNGYTLCLTVASWNYSFEAQQKGQMIKIANVLGLWDHYFGDVLDAPALPWRIAVNTFWDWFNKLPASISYSSNSAGHPLVGGGCAAPGTVGTADINFPGPFSESAPESFFALPATCATAGPYSADVCYTATQ